MGSLAFNFSKVRSSKNFWVSLLILILFMASLTSFFWLKKNNKLSEVNLTAVIGKITSIFSPEKNLASLEGGEAVSTSEFSFEGKEIVPPSTGKLYEEVAEKGEGITHLARKALKQYLGEKGFSLTLTSEQKIYVEDYMQNRTSDSWLKLGQKVNFSEDLIVAAIHKAQQLTGPQLENLRQYSSRVSFL